MEILTKIPFRINIDGLLPALHVEKGSDDEKDLRALAGKIEPLIKPKAVYEASYIQSREDDKIKTGNTTFESRMLRVNLEKVERVFPYIATCGNELEKDAQAPGDLIKQYWIDNIKNAALNAAREFLVNYLKNKYAVGKLSSMNPGAGTENLWPIEQQKQLFAIFGNVEELIGVKLTESYLMVPNKTVSGIYYPAEVTFETCQLCPRENCVGRKAPYNEKVLKSYGSR